MASSSPSTAQLTRDGYRFENPAPENFVFPQELEQRASQRSPHRVTRVLDSFVFIIKGKKDVLPSDWYTSQRWENVHVIGAVASLSGEESLLAQSGWFKDIKWRWLYLSAIERVSIVLDPRFRNGEPCFWLATKLGDYAMLSPHKGYLLDWASSISAVPNADVVPRVRRCSTDGPMPSWWGVEALELWSKATVSTPAARLKRLAPASPTQSDDTARSDAAGHQKHSPLGDPSEQTVTPTSARPANGLLTLARAAWDLENDAAPKLGAREPQHSLENDASKPVACEPQRKRARKL
ncbi:hypothetical protein FRC06_002571 [Ceratobasidium sp. 370]|nr:hypothetical protein FRC06_002571 [Ceratobasidium sp. 370]